MFLNVPGGLCRTDKHPRTKHGEPISACITWMCEGGRGVTTDTPSVTSAAGTAISGDCACGSGGTNVHPLFLKRDRWYISVGRFGRGVPSVLNHVPLARSLSSNVTIPPWDSTKALSSLISCAVGTVYLPSLLLALQLGMSGLRHVNHPSRRLSTDESHRVSMRPRRYLHP